MGNSSNDGCASALIIVLQIAAWLVSGMISWNFVEPDSFGGAILFLIVWSILGGILHFIAMMLGIFIFGDK